MEIWELVDEFGHPNGLLYERESNAPIPEGAFFRVVEVWTKIGDKLLVTQRHPSKWAGLKWEVTGGGVVLGEAVEEAAVRELYEETGIKAGQNDILPLGVKLFGAARVYSFILKLASLPSFSFDLNEVVDYKIVTKEEFVGMKDSFNEGTVSRFCEYSDLIFN